MTPIWKRAESSNIFKRRTGRVVLSTFRNSFDKRRGNDLLSTSIRWVLEKPGRRKTVAEGSSKTITENTGHRFWLRFRPDYSFFRRRRRAHLRRRPQGHWAVAESISPLVFLLLVILYSGMEASAGTAMYPMHRCKTIHLVRHAQGVHNVEGETDHSAYMKPEFFDAQVTPLGWNQVDRLREHVKKCGLANKVDLVICSPLMRTMQTAAGVFGGENYINGVSAPPLMVENAGNSGRPAISSLGSPPFLAIETCRERLGVHPCDKRRSITEYRTLFPAIDFSLIESDEDVLWEPNDRETYDSLAARGVNFIDWLWTREEKEIAVVTHSGLLWHTLRLYSKECHPTVRHEVSKYFANCELRSLVLVDRSMLGSDSSSSNYPGKIPAGLDLPSDVADKKHIGEAHKN